MSKVFKSMWRDLPENVRDVLMVIGVGSISLLLGAGILLLFSVSPSWILDMVPVNDRDFLSPFLSWYWFLIGSAILGVLVLSAILATLYWWRYLSLLLRDRKK